MSDTIVHFVRGPRNGETMIVKGRPDQLFVPLFGSPTWGLYPVAVTEPASMNARISVGAYVRSAPLRYDKDAYVYEWDKAVEW